MSLPGAQSFLCHCEGQSPEAISRETKPVLKGRGGKPTSPKYLAIKGLRENHQKSFDPGGQEFGRKND